MSRRSPAIKSPRHLANVDLARALAANTTADDLRAAPVGTTVVYRTERYGSRAVLKVAPDRWRQTYPHAETFTDSTIPGSVVLLGGLG